MSRPNALIELLDNLAAESSGSTVVTLRKSSAVIYMDDSDEKGINFSPEECELLFDTAETVEQLFEALGQPINASVELNSLSVEEEVMDALNENFSSVMES